MEICYLYILWPVQFNMRNVTFNKKFETNLQLGIKRPVWIMFNYLRPLTPGDKTMIQVNSCNYIEQLLWRIPSKQKNLSAEVSIN